MAAAIGEALDTGLLLFRTGTGAWQLSWMSRDGKPEVVASAGQDKRRGDVRISPDGSRVALNRDVDDGSGRDTMDIWLYEFARGALLDGFPRDACQAVTLAGSVYGWPNVP